MSSDSDEEVYAPTLQNILDQKELKWVFVGGKGGVGKTTTSCSLAVALAAVRESVLVISTDPAHNISDAFGQKFSKTPTLVNGFENLFALEIDPTVEPETADPLADATAQNFIGELASSVPGIDEAMSFAELMRQVQTMEYSIIIFDTAPTGHTLRLLAFPSVMEKAFEVMTKLKDRFSGIINQVTALMGNAAAAQESIMAKMEDTKLVIETIHRQFQDPMKTTFVCVCIPEFLSLYETERLVQELAKFDIDSHNVVVNQVLFPDDDCKCRKCLARVRMQTKYVNQIQVLYDEYHVALMPLLDAEVRGVPGLRQFAELLLTEDKANHPLVRPPAEKTPE
jgi:arsenite-transporting ATPase